eukprot:GGOE01014539.1.p1 GENE.GGOE01014539.1~~GGOE01014539.1.p1  ORF type:complete len:717 (+),score=81.07 GGOE01014539.1:323-2152(+)
MTPPPRRAAYPPRSGSNPSTRTRNRTPPRPRSPPPRQRSPPPRRNSPPPPYPAPPSYRDHHSRASPRPGPPSRTSDRPQQSQETLESRRRQLQLREQELLERERQLKKLAEEAVPREPRASPPNSRSYRADRHDRGSLDRAPLALQPPPYRKPEPREERRTAPLSLREPPAPAVPIVSAAMTLEGQLEALHKRNDSVAMLEAFESAKLAGVQPTAQSYLHMLSTLSMADDASNMESIYLDLCFQQALPLRPEQLHEAILILSQSPLKGRTMELYTQLRRTGHLIQNPVTYRLLLSCCTDATGAMAIFEDMKKSDMLLTLPIYHSILSFLAGQPQSIRTVLQDMTAHNVNPSDVLGQMKAPEALAMAQAIVQSGVVVEEPLFLQLLQKVGSTDLPGLLAMWRKAPALMTLPCAAGLLSLAVQHGQLAVGLSVWHEVQKHQLPGDAPLAMTLIEGLSAARDTRIFEVYSEAKSRLQPSLALFNYVLAVAAQHRIVHAAKEMWRDMQANDVLPDDEALHFILQAASRDQRALVELFDVIRASQLAIPSASASILFEAFNRTEEGRARIPDLRRACPELNTTHPLPVGQGLLGAASQLPRQTVSRPPRPYERS